jgi:hypothetical protein
MEAAIAMGIALIPNVTAIVPLLSRRNDPSRFFHEFLIMGVLRN